MSWLSEELGRPKTDMQSLFEKIADAHTGYVQAEEVSEGYLRLLIADGTPYPLRVEIRAVCVLHPSNQGPVHLVRVGCPDDGEPVLVSPIPSAILAVALR